MRAGKHSASAEGTAAFGTDIIDGAGKLGLGQIAGNQLVINDEGWRAIDGKGLGQVAVAFQNAGRLWALHVFFEPRHVNTLCRRKFVDDFLRNFSLMAEHGHMQVPVFALFIGRNRCLGSVIGISAKYRELLQDKSQVLV